MENDGKEKEEIRKRGRVLKTQLYPTTLDSATPIKSKVA